MAKQATRLGESAWLIGVGVRKSKGAYEYPRLTIPVEALRKAGVSPGDILVLIAAREALLLAKAGGGGEPSVDPVALTASVLEGLGYRVRSEDERVLGCRNGECILVVRVRLPEGLGGGDSG